MTACARLVVYALVVTALAASHAVAAAPPAQPTRAQLDFFESKVRPVLIQHCYKCHSATAEKLKGGLRLDSIDAILKGGDSGPALVPGNPDKSLLVEAVRYEDEDTAMPPKGRLPDTVVADLVAWVKMGAPDPRVPTAVPASKLTGLTDTARAHFMWDASGDDGLMLLRWRDGKVSAIEVTFGAQVS